MTIRLYRAFLLASLAIEIIAMVVGAASTAGLPPELREYRERTNQAIPVWIAVVGLLALVGGIVCIIGLWMLRRWARTLYMALLIAGVVIVPFAGPYVETGWSYGLYALANLLGGVIVALSYWSPVSAHFAPSRAAA